MITLNTKEIKDLALLAGLEVVGEIDPDTLEAEYDIVKCPKEGILDPESDEGPEVYRYLAFISEYHEEGAHPLGDKIEGVENDPTN